MRLFQIRRPLIAALPPVPPRANGFDHAAAAIDRLVDRHADDLLALSEATGRITRTTAALERIAAALEARHVRYAWTEQLAAELRNIAHDTPPTVGG